MTRSTAFALLVLAGPCVLVPGPGRAADCPAPSDLDGMVRAIEVSSSCTDAAGIMDACAFGASGDVALGAAVTKVCERDFLVGLPGAERAAYGRQRAACLNPYRNQSGTLYRSREAFCQAGVSQRYSASALRRSTAATRAR